MALGELEYHTNNPSESGGIREGSMEVGQVRGSMLVRGSNAFYPCLDLMM